MGNLAYIRSSSTYNLAAAVTVNFTASSEDAAYPVENVVAEPISKGWRSTGISSESILIDFGSAKTIDLVVLVNHNLTSAATITVKAGTTSGVSDFTQAMTWREFDAWVKFSALSKRYWKIEFADSGNSDGYIQVGYLFVGVRVLTDKNYEFGSAIEFRAVNLSTRTDFGVVVSERVYKQKVYSFSWRLTATQATAMIENFMDQLQGDSELFFLIPDSDVYAGNIVRMASGPVKQIPLSTYILTSGKFTEEPRGVRVTS